MQSPHQRRSGRAASWTCTEIGIFDAEAAMSGAQADVLRLTPLGPRTLLDKGEAFMISLATDAYRSSAMSEWAISSETLCNRPDPCDRYLTLYLHWLARADFDTNDSPAAGPPYQRAASRTFGCSKADSMAGARKVFRFPGFPKHRKPSRSGWGSGCPTRSRREHRHRTQQDSARNGARALATPGQFFRICGDACDSSVNPSAVESLSLRHA
jgi:hypothetical protein